MDFKDYKGPGSFLGRINRKSALLRVTDRILIKIDTMLHYEAFCTAMDRKLKFWILAWSQAPETSSSYCLATPTKFGTSRNLITICSVQNYKLHVAK